MRIVIAGAGEVGSHLAKLLSAEEQDILLIDDNQERLAVLDANYNLMTYPGNPTSFSTLREASVGSADLFIALTRQATWWPAALRRVSEQKKRWRVSIRMTSWPLRTAM